MSELAIIPTRCPKCGCPFWETSGFATADVHHAWKDADGTWYNGPAREEQVRRCSHCGWSQRIVKERGKTTSLESDPTAS